MKIYKARLAVIIVAIGIGGLVYQLKSDSANQLTLKISGKAADLLKTSGPINIKMIVQGISEDELYKGLPSAIKTFIQSKINNVFEKSGVATTAGLTFKNMDKHAFNSVLVASIYEFNSGKLTMADLSKQAPKIADIIKHLSNDVQAQILANLSEYLDIKRAEEMGGE